MINALTICDQLDSTESPANLIELAKVDVTIV